MDKQTQAEQRKKQSGNPKTLKIVTAMRGGILVCATKQHLKGGEE